MSTVDKLLWYIFVLSAFLIAVVYFVGLSTDAKTVLGAGQSFLNTVTGRKSDGSFAGYPTGATLAA